MGKYVVHNGMMKDKNRHESTGYVCYMSPKKSHMYRGSGKTRREDTNNDMDEICLALGGLPIPFFFYNRVRKYPSFFVQSMHKLPPSFQRNKQTQDVVRKEAISPCRMLS